MDKQWRNAEVGEVMKCTAAAYFVTGLDQSACVDWKPVDRTTSRKKVAIWEGHDVAQSGSNLCILSKEPEFISNLHLIAPFQFSSSLSLYQR